MSATVSIYQDLPRGSCRLGLFTYRGPGRSLYAISQAFHRKYPEAHKKGTLFIAIRRRINGKFVDDLPPLLMDGPQQVDVTAHIGTNC